MITTVVGIDVGFKGALAFYDYLDGGGWHIEPMPIVEDKDGKKHLDEARLYKLFNYPDNGDWLVMIELVHAMPKQGVVSTFRFGEQFGFLRGMCNGMSIPYDLVTPQKWKKAVLGDYVWKKNKKASIKYVQDKHPKISLLRTPRCTEPSDGIADAVCLVEYGKLQRNG